MFSSSRALTFLVGGAIAFGPACSSGNSSTGGPAGQTGSTCSSAAQCFPGLDAAALHGQATCLTQLQNGYCTHTCTSDVDCCAVPGECRTGFKEVCASFESSGQMYCFLSCSAADVAAAPDAGTTDPTTYCQDWASASFTCRSTGGGAQQRKFCGP
jgi:hypothetical protein